MLWNLKDIESGSIIIDYEGEILYSSLTCENETNHFLEEIRVFDRIRNDVIGIEIYENYKVSLKKVIIKKYTVYLIEFKDAREDYIDTSDLKVIINKTREKLNKLIMQELDHQNDKVLDLSRKLDILIHYYISLEVGLRS